MLAIGDSHFKCFVTGTASKQTINAYVLFFMLVDMVNKLTTENGIPTYKNMLVFNIKKYTYLLVNCLSHSGHLLCWWCTFMCFFSSDVSPNISALSLHSNSFTSLIEPFSIWLSETATKTRTVILCERLKTILTNQLVMFRQLRPWAEAHLDLVFLLLYHLTGFLLLGIPEQQLKVPRSCCFSNTRRNCRS